MNLFENDELLKPKQQIKVKAPTVLIVIISILSVISIVIIGLITYLKGTILTITLDGQDANKLKSILIFEEDKIYIPIKKIAEYLQYQTYNGDYITLSEEVDKCYIENIEEKVAFTLDSNIITKVRGGVTEQVKIVEPISQINEELHITSEGAEQAFNLYFNYNKEKNEIIIQTLSHLYNRYLNHAISIGYSPIENEIFDNKLAILEGLIVVKGSNGNYGVININNEVILETKYQSIRYLPKTSDFLVSSNNKMGIIASDKSTKISLKYDSIEIFTNKNEMFYLIGNSGKYGLLDVNGNEIIYPEYTKIGMSVSEYSKNNVTTGHVLNGEVIPVENNGKWALFNIKGEKITDFIYDGFGCQVKNNNTYSVLQIPEYNLLVAKQGEKYDLITIEGKSLFKDAVLNLVYISVSSGKTNYYISYGEQKIELFSFLEENGIKKSNK
jgi:hypothetical protein